MPGFGEFQVKTTAELNNAARAARNAASAKQVVWRNGVKHYKLANGSVVKARKSRRNRKSRKSSRKNRRN